MKRNSSNLIRLAGPLLALCFAGSALAATKDDGSGAVAQATCYGNATQQYLIELGQCAQNTEPTIYANCQSLAQLHYALAQIACSQKPAIVGAGNGAGLKALPLRPARLSGPGQAGAAGSRVPGLRLPGSRLTAFMPAGSRHRR